MPERPRSPGLSVVVIARNEEDRLPATIASVRFADEVVVVVDPRSSDRTEEVARAAGAVVVVRPFDGFGHQKNAGVAAARGPWILALDADETAGPELAAAIPEALAAAGRSSPPRPAAFRVRIRLEFLGRELRHGRGAVSRPVRLFHKDHARFSDAPVHEGVLASGRPGTLRGSVRHRSYRSLSHYLEKLDLYTSLAAETRAAQGRAPSPLLPLRIAATLLDSTVLRLGFLDGLQGLTYAGLSAAAVLIKNFKLAERLDRERSGTPS